FGRDVNNPGDANWPFATALLGNFANYTETNNRPRYRYERKNWQWFAQDTWKLNRRLTLTFGVRFASFTNWDVTVGSGRAVVPSRWGAKQESPLVRPAPYATGRRVAQGSVSGQLFPAAYIAVFVPNAGPPYSATLKSNAPS